MSVTYSLECPEEVIPALYVVSVPIGNLYDITLRALHILRNVDKIYTEDTRNTRKLLQLYQIPVCPLVRCDDFKQQEMCEQIKQDIRAGFKIALVSDAGTPLISDPGYPIIAALRQQNLPVIPIAGVCAAIAAVSVSGLPTNHFHFLGFPPKKSSAQTSFLQEHITQTGTYIFYERTDRLAEIMQSLYERDSTALFFIAREISKKFEQFFYGSYDAWQTYKDNIPERGEAVLCVFITITPDAPALSLEEAILQGLSEQIPSKLLSQILSEKYPFSKKDIYQQIQILKQDV